MFKYIKGDNLLSILEIQYVFYGVKSINEKLDHIIGKLKLREKIFEVKLIICEAITNAYIHGNKGDDSKPIILTLNKKEDVLNIMVEDCGKLSKDIKIKNSLDENDILYESGRGLFIIAAYTEEIKLDNGCLKMKMVV